MVSLKKTVSILRLFCIHLKTFKKKLSTIIQNPYAIKKKLIKLHKNKKLLHDLKQKNHHE